MCGREHRRRGDSQAGFLDQREHFRNDIVVSEERVNKVSETYRGIRNALRYQLSNLYDFDPAKHIVADDKLTGLDRWILGEFSKLEKDVCDAYDKSEFHVVYQKVSQFIAVELVPLSSNSTSVAASAPVFWSAVLRPSYPAGSS